MKATMPDRRCPCSQLLSRYNKHKHCHKCLRKQSDDYITRVRSLLGPDAETPRNRVLTFLEGSPHPVRARQVAVGALVGDNETYRLLSDLLKSGKIKYEPDGRLWSAA